MEKVFWTFGELEAELANVHGIDDTKRTAFQSRLKNFHRLGFPAGFKAAKGRATQYSPLQIAEMALALEMTQLGLPPDRATWILSANRWPSLMALEMAARELGKNPTLYTLGRGLAQEALAMFLYFDPAALHPLTLNMPSKMLPDLDEAANSFFYGGMGIIREGIVNWTSGRNVRLSLINVTSLIGIIATSPYEEGSEADLEYRTAFFGQLEAEAHDIREEWERGDVVDDYVFNLLEREEITDPLVLAERTNIAIDRARWCLEQVANWKRQGDK